MESKKLSLLDSTMLIMGSMIGSGIFIVPAAMSRELGSPGLLLAAWAVTGVLTWLAALSYGELAAMMPKAGGQYIYLKEAWHPIMGFLYGWALFAVIQTGTIAAVAVAFAKFTGVFIPAISDQNILLDLGFIKLQTQQIVALTVVWILTLTNFRSVKTGAFIQNLFTFTKIGAIAFLIIAGIYHSMHHDAIPFQTATNTENTLTMFIGVFCVSLVGSIFSADAWNNITFTGGEIEKPEKNLPLSLLLGTGIVLLLYFIINVVYLNALSFESIQHAPSDRAGTLLLQTVFGDGGMYIMAALIMVSTFGCINGLTLSGARVYYAMSIDGLFFKKASQLNKNHSPQWALVIQGIWTSLLTLSGSYSDLLDYVVFAVLLFYILTVAGLFRLRITKAEAPRPYKAFGYPLLPALYILMAMIICISLLILKPEPSYKGLIIVLTGIPIYWFISRGKTGTNL